MTPTAGFRGRVVLVCLVVGGWMGAACAPVATTSAQVGEPCAEEETQQAMNACWSGAAAGAEADVDEVVGRVGAELMEADRAATGEVLARAQAAWAQYRDLHCETVAAPYEGGSAEPTVRAACRYELAGRRAAELRALLDEWSAR